MATQSGSIASSASRYLDTFRSTQQGFSPPRRRYRRTGVVLVDISAGRRGPLLASEIAYAAQQGVPLASIAVPLSGVLALLGGLSVLARLPGEMGRVAADSVPRARDPVAAQFLGGEGSDDGPDADGHVHEKSFHDRRGVAHHPVRCRAPEPGRAQPSLNRRAPPEAGRSAGTERRRDRPPGVERRGDRSGVGNGQAQRGPGAPWAPPSGDRSREPRLTP